MSNIITISGIRGFIDENGVAQLNAEDVARGWGFTRTAQSGNMVVRWERVNKYLSEFGFMPTNGHGVGENDFIPENMVYRLGFKASNEAAQIFQAKLADEVLPALRKNGTYSVKPTPQQIKKPRRRSHMIKTAVNDIGATAKALTQVFGVRQEMALSVAYSTVMKNYEMDLSPLRSLVPAATHNTGRLIPTELGKRLGGIPPKKVNELLESLGLQVGKRDINNRKKWELTDKGKEYGEYVPATNNTNGHCEYQIQWSEKLLPLLEADIKKEGND